MSENRHILYLPDENEGGDGYYMLQSYKDTWNLKLKRF